VIDALPASPVDVLVDRLNRGVEVLFDLEQRGELGREYARWLQRWLDLLSEYETLQAA
jgi:hypothetical protein